MTGGGPQGSGTASSTKEEWYSRFTAANVAVGTALALLGGVGVVGYQYVQTRVALQKATDALEKERVGVVKDIAKESSKDLAKKYGLREAEVVAMRKTLEHQLKARKLAYDLLHSTPHDKEYRVDHAKAQASKSEDKTPQATGPI